MTRTAMMAGNSNANPVASTVAAASPNASPASPTSVAKKNNGITGNSVHTLPTSVKYSIPGRLERYGLRNDQSH